MQSNSTLTHRQLCEELSAIKGGWFEVPLGSVFMARPQIADVVVIRKSYTRFCLDIFEVKRRRGDLLSDVRSKKYEGYLPSCHRFYYAVTSDVGSVADIPEGIGLYVRGEKGWSCRKGARCRNIDVERDVLLALLFHESKCSKRVSNVLRETYNAKYWYSGAYKAQEYGKKLGITLSLFTHDVLDTIQKANWSSYQIQEILQREYNRQNGKLYNS